MSLHVRICDMAFQILNEEPEHREAIKHFLRVHLPIAVATYRKPDPDSDMQVRADMCELLLDTWGCRFRRR